MEALLDRLLELLPADEKTRPDVLQKRETVKGRIVELEKATAPDPAKNEKNGKKSQRDQ